MENVCICPNIALSIQSNWSLKYIRWPHGNLSYSTSLNIFLFVWGCGITVYQISYENKFLLCKYGKRFCLEFVCHYNEIIPSDTLHFYHCSHMLQSIAISWNYIQIGPMPSPYLIFLPYVDRPILFRSRVCGSDSNSSTCATRGATGIWCSWRSTTSYSIFLFNCWTIACLAVVNIDSYVQINVTVDHVN